MIPFTDEELVNPVKNAIEKVRPGITSDGGDINNQGLFMCNCKEPVSVAVVPVLPSSIV
jgi:Fe-S cluster biogenesis protein NfuA